MTKRWTVTLERYETMRNVFAYSWHARMSQPTVWMHAKAGGHWRRFDTPQGAVTSAARAIARVGGKFDCLSLPPAPRSAPEIQCTWPDAIARPSIRVRSIRVSVVRFVGASFVWLVTMPLVQLKPNRGSDTRRQAYDRCMRFLKSIDVHAFLWTPDPPGRSQQRTITERNCYPR